MLILYKKLNNIYIIPAFVLALFNIIFLRNSIISFFIVILEIIFLLILLFKLNIEKYLCWFMIFLATSIEFQAFTSNVESDAIYGFKHFKILGMNLSIVFVLLPFFLILLTKLKNQTFSYQQKKTNLFLVLTMFFVLMTAGIMMGSINLIMNDNNVRGIQNYFFAFLGDTYLSTWPILLFFLIYFALMQSKSNGAEFEKALIAIIAANCTAPIIPAILGFKGSYGDLDYMLVSSAAMFSPFIVLFPAYEKYRKNAWLFYLVFGLGMLVPMIFFSYVSGKHILILFILPIIYMLIKLKNNKKNLRQALMFVLIFGLILYFAFNISLKESGTLFHGKFKEATSILQVWHPDYLMLIEPSSMFRVSEAINVWFEYSQNPIQSILGKGYMGTVVDHIGGFGSDPSGSFPIEQYNNGTFYSLHEITGYFLKYGLLGLFVWLYIIKITAKNISHNPWIVIGCFWFILLVGYSQTMSIIGVMSLTYGIYLVDNEKKNPAIKNCLCVN